MNKLKLSSKQKPVALSGVEGQPEVSTNIQDDELQSLISMSGLQEKFIAEQLGITPEYFSMMKSGARHARKTRRAAKTWLISFISHNLKLAA